MKVGYLGIIVLRNLEYRGISQISPLKLAKFVAKTETLAFSNIESKFWRFYNVLVEVLVTFFVQCPERQFSSSHAVLSKQKPTD